MKFVTNRDNAKRSGPHRHVEKVLENIGIAYISEQPFDPYSVDIYLPEWHLAIEVDGPLHNKKKDEERDAFLYERYGVRLLRLNTNGDFRNKVLEDTIINYIDDNCDEVESRKQKWLMMP